MPSERDRREAAVDPAPPGRGLRGGFALSLTLAGLALVLVASRQTLVTAIPVGRELGLFQLLPPTYWAGLVVMGAAMLVALRSGTATPFALVGVLFFATLAGTPVLFEPNPPVWDSYFHYAGSLEIGTLGHIPDLLTRYARNWPGFFLFALTLATLANLSPFALVGLNPFLTGGLTFLALFVLLRRFLDPPSLARGGAVLAGFLNVWGQYHASPQSIGLILALLLLALVWDLRVRVRIAAAILAVGLAVSHPTSMILILSILALHAIISFLFRFLHPRLDRHRRPLGAGTPALAFGTLWVGWLMFQAVGSAQDAERAVVQRMRFILQLPEETLNIATARAVENLFVWAPLIRLGGLALVGLALVGALLLVLWRQGPTHRVRVLLTVLVAPVLFGAGDILAFQGQLYDRALLLFAVLAPGAVLFGVTRGGMGRTARRAVVVLLAFASLAVASTLYYQEAFYLVPDRSVAVAEFLQHTTPETVVLDGFYPEPIWLETGPAPWNTLKFYELYPAPFHRLSGEVTVLAVYDPTTELWYRQWRGGGIYQFYQEQVATAPLIYDNGEAKVFLVTSLTGDGSP